MESSVEDYFSRELEYLYKDQKSRRSHYAKDIFKEFQATRGKAIFRDVVKVVQQFRSASDCKDIYLALKITHSVYNLFDQELIKPAMLLTLYSDAIVKKALEKYGWNTFVDFRNLYTQRC